MRLKPNPPILGALVIVAAVAAAGYGAWWWTRRRRQDSDTLPVRNPAVHQIRGQTDARTFAPANRETPLPRPKPLVPSLTKPFGSAAGKAIPAVPALLVSPAPIAASSEPPALSMLVPATPASGPHRADPETARTRPAFRNRNHQMVIASAIVIGAAMLCYGTLAHVQSTPKMIGTLESVSTTPMDGSADAPSKKRATTEPEPPAEAPSKAAAQAANGSDIQNPTPVESADGSRPKDEDLNKPQRRSLHRRHLRRQRSMSQKTRAFLHKVF